MAGPLTLTDIRIPDLEVTVVASVHQDITRHSGSNGVHHHIITRINRDMEVRLVLVFSTMVIILMPPLHQYTALVEADDPISEVVGVSIKDSLSGHHLW